MKEKTMTDRMRVLLVEDDEDDYLVTRRLLTEVYGERLSLEWIRGYEEALKALTECDYDVCLFDYRLGARNGLELLREVGAECYPAPIILLTGQGDREVDEAAARAGASDYLVKGETDAALLERAIRYSIHHKQGEAARLQLVNERKARIEAEAANRAKDAFLAMITHELRSPLNAVLGWTRILRTRQVDEATAAHALEMIEQSARSQSHLIEDLLDTARITSGKLRLEVRPVVLSEVIEAAMEVVRPAAESRGIELQKEFDEHVNIVSGDPDRLQQVLWNLLSNAIKFTPAGGRVTVRLERADPYAQIAVTDTGQGISPDFLPSVFDLFSQQPGQAKGTRRKSGLGIGLSLARHLVELHGGTIEVESEGEGRGASFTLRFPLRAVRAKEGTARDSAGISAAPAETLAGLQVLLVDDETDARDLVTLLLKQYGARVTPVASASEAIATLESGEHYDVLVSDIGMPDVDGLTLIARVRALAPGQGGAIPAVALTAFGRGVDRIRALSAGFQFHIPKPVEPAELILVIASLTGRAAHGMNA